MSNRLYATGKRKNAVARVWVAPSAQGRILVNRRPADEYFTRLAHQNMVQAPFTLTQSIGQYDVYSTVEGGGLSGQAGALRHGISKALALHDLVAHRPLLKKEGFLTRDSRVVERKKPGKPKARRSFQFTKR